MEEFIFHSKPYFWLPRVTVVGVLDKGQLKIAVSRCSENDQFVKKIGVEKARKRVESGNLISIYSIEKCSISDFVSIATDIAEMVILNARLIKKDEK